ncbi:membrane protein [Flammeovirgaceae bacterium 311]|nr:membrane protein [Flammeovirgaceae bacterium 311]
MNKSFLVLAGLMMLCSTALLAQDPQFSQYYANPLYLNPALTGNLSNARVGVNFRQQWPSIDATFTTYTAYFDNYFADYNSGVGVMLMHDRQGIAGLASTSAHLQYAYQLPLTRKITFRPGVSLGVIERRLDYSNLQFADQFNGTGFNGIRASSENLADMNPFYQFDLSFGGMIYTPRLFAGISASHLNEPYFSFNEDGDERLPVKYSVHGGYRIALKADEIRNEYDRYGRERSITPTAEFKMQREFKQLSVGAYLTWEPLVVGLWYRGLPVTEVEGVRNKNESAILLIGLVRGNMNIGYSFDYTLSSLSMATGGAHEVSLSYTFDWIKSKRPPRNVRQIPCPEF